MVPVVVEPIVVRQNLASVTVMLSSKGHSLEVPGTTVSRMYTTGYSRSWVTVMAGMDNCKA